MKQTESGVKTTSLRRQLSAGLSLGLIVLFLSFWGVTTYSLHHLTEDYLVKRLTHDAEAIPAALQRDQQGSLALNLTQLEPIFLRQLSGHYFMLRSANQQLLSPSLNNFAFEFRTTDQAVQIYETAGPAHGDILVRLTRIEFEGQTLQLAVAEDHTPIERAIWWLDGIMALLSLVGLIGIWLWQQTILRRSFASLTPIRQALLDAPHQGIPADLVVPQEVAPLVQTLNQTLAQLHNRLARSRQRTGNLAHSLKTPLNLIYQQLESGEISADLRHKLSEQAQRINQLIERELKKARLAGGDLHAQTLTLPDDISALLQGFSKLYRDKNIAYQTQLPAPGLVLTMDKEDGYELLGNLLDNASKWCRHQVTLSLTVQQRDLLIEIDDDGEGVDIATLDLLKQRGQRLDESQPGYGLGLSIVDEIVQIYQGEWMMQPSSILGGLQVRIHLPGLVVSKD